MDCSFDYKKIHHIRYSLKGANKEKTHGLFMCWCLLTIRMCGYFFRSPHKFKKVDEVFVVIPSANNKRSTMPILNEMKHKNYSIVERFYDFLPFGGIYLKSLIHPKQFRSLYRTSSSDERKMIRAHFDEFAVSYELYKAIGKFYEYNCQIRLLIVSNDHFPIIRSFIDQANIHGIKTLYSQHASVSEFFPPLMFDYSFLDGEESFTKYRSIGDIKGDVFLVGSPRFDVITQLKRQNSNYVGIAFNLIDDYGNILSLIKTLKKNGYTSIVVRPHPQQDKNDSDWSVFTNEGCEISHPLEENPFQFISRLSFLIAGTSSIHLDAALLHVPSVLFDMKSSNGRIVLDLDYYGYAKKGLTPIAQSAEEVVLSIKKPRLPSLDIIRYYDATFGTKCEGRSSMLAAQFVDSFLDGKESEILASVFQKTVAGYYIIKN